MSANDSSDAAFNIVPQLDGTNYPSWKTQMISYLQSKGLYKFLTNRATTLRERAENDEDLDALDELMDNDEKALGYLKCHISPSFLELVLNSETALDAWQRLEDFFAGREAFNKFHLLEQLMDGKLIETGKPTLDVQKYLKEKTELVRRLNAIGFQVPEDFLIAIILARLPESFDAMRRVFESQANPTVLKLNSELNKEALRKRKRESDKAFYGQDGDKDLIPPPPKKPKLDIKKKFFCTYCDCKGHEATKCWLNPESTNHRPDFVKKILKAAGGAPKE